MLKSSRCLTQGFTLIELMIVIAIVGILAAIALPAYQDYIARAQMSEALSLVSGLKSQVIEYYTSHSTCPNNLQNEGGIASPSEISGKYVAQVQTDAADLGAYDCAIVATMKLSGVAAGIKGKQLGLAFKVTSGSFKWDCASDAQPKYLPVACHN